MKFLNKYELMEPVTGGAVETFVARDIANGEKVIVHMFAGSEVLPDKPALQWALQSLRGLAPTPMGSVIEGGRYEQTSHAYLVTKFPADPVALQHWIRFYTLQAEATQPTLGTPVPRVPLQAQVSASDKPKQPVGEFTKAFFGSATADVDSHSSSTSDKPAGNKAMPDPADNWSRKPAGAFTKEFLSGFDLGLDVKKSSDSAGAAKDARKPQSFTAEFLIAGNEGDRTEKKPALPKKDSISSLFSAQASGNTPFPLPAEGQKPGNDVLDLSPSPGNARTGEFTKFFRGPFGGQSTSGTPASMNVVPPPRPREKVGEFTQLFGSAAKSPPSSESGALLEPPASRQSSNFTDVFGTPRSSADGKSDAIASVPSDRANEIAWNEPATSQVAGADSNSMGDPTFREPGTSLQNPTLSQGAGESTGIFANEIAWDRPAPPRRTVAGTGSTEQTPRGSPPAFEPISSPSGAPKSGATSVFTPPGGPSSAPPVPVPNGPSEYTRIISPPQPPPPEEAKPADPAAPAVPAFSLPQVAIPPVSIPKPPTPAMPQPQVPQPPHLQVPAPPHLQYPQMPQPMAMPTMQAPQLPSVPQAPQPPGAAAPQKFPYWPLIIVMNVLLIVAVALILYFALKH